MEFDYGRHKYDENHEKGCEQNMEIHTKNGDKQRQNSDKLLLTKGKRASRIRVSFERKKAREKARGLAGFLLQFTPEHYRQGALRVRRGL